MRSIVSTSYEDITYELYNTYAIVEEASQNIEFANILLEVNNKPITEIFKEAFWNCSELKSVKIPNSVTKIGSWAFAECVKLSSLELPNSITEIGSCAFDSCFSLVSIKIPNSITKIEDRAFAYCKSLASINIPDTIIRISGNAFKRCPNISHVQFSQALVDRPDADKIFNQLFEAGLHTREILLRIPTI